MKVWKYGDSINTDMLFPGKYTYTCATAEEIRPHLLEDLDPGFAKGVKAGDFVFAGTNFGCGSSREQPVVGLKAVGVDAIVAKSFARIFYRAAINQGLTLIESPEAVEAYADGADVSIDRAKNEIRVGDRSFPFPGLPREIVAIQKAGGLLPYVRAKLSGKGS
ncbi:MAG: LeuD/DmdB family oxidoreductase small subunit [Planctomycetota bacterium]